MPADTTQTSSGMSPSYNHNPTDSNSSNPSGSGYGRFATVTNLPVVFFLPEASNTSDLITVPNLPARVSSTETVLCQTGSTSFPEVANWIGEAADR